MCALTLTYFYTHVEGGYSEYDVCVRSHSPTLLHVCCSLSSMDCPSSSSTLLLRLVLIPQQNRTQVPLSLGLEHSLLRRRGRPCHQGACSLGKTAKKRVKEKEEEEEAECHLLLKYAAFRGVWLLKILPFFSAFCNLLIIIYT